MAQLTAAETNLSLKLIDYFTSFQLSKQPWTSYKINHTILLLDIGNEGIKPQFSYDQQLIDRCAIVLKYLDSDDCHAYSTQQDCSNIKHCQWIGNHCDTMPTSSAQQPMLSNVLVFYLINFIFFLFY